MTADPTPKALRVSIEEITQAGIPIEFVVRLARWFIRPNTIRDGSGQYDGIVVHCQHHSLPESPKVLVASFTELNEVQAFFKALTTNNPLKK